MTRLRLLSFVSKYSRGSKGGTVVRALASHQCGLGSNDYIGVDANDLWVDFVVSRGVFSASTPVIPCHKKSNISSPIRPDMVDEEPLRGCPPSESFFIRVRAKLGQSHSPKLSHNAIERRSVRSRYHGSKISDDNDREFLQRRRRTAKKTIGLDWQKNIFTRASRFFVHFSAVVARPRHETS